MIVLQLRAGGTPCHHLAAQQEDHFRCWFQYQSIQFEYRYIYDISDFNLRVICPTGDAATLFSSLCSAGQVAETFITPRLTIYFNFE